MPLVLAVLLAGGCGGTSKQELHAMLDDYNHGIAAHDWPRACQRMAPEYVDALRQSLLKRHIENPPRACAQLWRFAVAHQAVSAGALNDATADAQFVEAEVDGDTAAVSYVVTAGGQSRTLIAHARRTGGRWKITEITT